MSDSGPNREKCLNSHDVTKAAEKMEERRLASKAWYAKYKADPENQARYKATNDKNNDLKSHKTFVFYSWVLMDLIRSRLVQRNPSIRSSR